MRLHMVMKQPELIECGLPRSTTRNHEWLQWRLQRTKQPFDAFVLQGRDTCASGACDGVNRPNSFPARTPFHMGKEPDSLETQQMQKIPLSPCVLRHSG